MQTSGARGLLPDNCGDVGGDGVAGLLSSTGGGKPKAGRGRALILAISPRAVNRRFAEL